MKIQYGFTLVEMAVVLVIIGILLAGFITPYSAQRTYTKISDTGQQLEKIKEALMGFAATQTPARLPCPDTDNDGEEGPLCNVEGDLPWKTLGIGKFDGWSNHFRYRVDNAYGNLIPNSKSVANSLDTSDLKVRDCQETLLTIEEQPDPDDASKKITSNIVAIIFSRGKNRLANAKNSDDDGGTYNVYTQDMQQLKCQFDGKEEYFDDILVWLPDTILINRLVIAGRWYAP